MAKKKHDRRRSEERLGTLEIPTSSGPYIHPNATVGPEASLGTPTDVTWMSRDSTSAPEAGEEEEVKKSYAESTPALIDKYVLSRDFVPFTLVVVGIGWIFIQDNAAGNLKNWNELLWTLQKSGTLLFLFAIVLACQWAYKKWFS